MINIFTEYNLISDYCEIRIKEMNNVFHDNLKSKELIKKLYEIKNNNNFSNNDEKRKLIIKIKNEVNYIEKFLLKEEYNKKIEYEIIDWNYFYNIRNSGHNHLQSSINILNYYNIYLIDADEVYEIISKNKKIKDPDYATYKISKYFSLENDSKVFKNLYNIIKKYNKYFVSKTRYNDHSDYSDED